MSVSLKPLIHFIQTPHDAGFFCYNGLYAKMISYKWGISVMKKNSCRSSINAAGFTLIELLVVVLIIGVLAAIALPQYQKAVLKARGAEAVAAARAVSKAASVYYTEHGTYNGIDNSTTDIKIPDLTNWRYLQYGSDYNRGRSSFWMEYPNSGDSFDMDIVEEKNWVYLRVFQSNGGVRQTMYCTEGRYPVRPRPTCQDYFNCSQKTITIPASRHYHEERKSVCLLN